MFSVKVLLVLCLAFFSCEASPSINQAQARGILDSVDQLLQVLLRIVLHAIEDAENTLVNLLRNIQKQAGDFLKNISESIQKTVNHTVNKINNLIEIGEVVSECTDGVEEALNKLRHDILASTKACLDSSVDHGVDILRKARASINSDVVQVVSLTAQLSACNKHPIINQATCLLRLIENITGATVQLPQTIADAVGNTSAALGLVNDEFHTCLRDKVDKFEQDVEMILANVTQCINNDISTITSYTQITQTSTHE